MPVRIVAIVALTVAYLALSQWLMASPESPWNAALLLSPMLAVVAVGAWRGGQRVRALLAALAIAALTLQAVLGVQIPAPLLYLSEHVGINLMLALWFGSTLQKGGKALISTLAERVHGSLTPDMVTYTRNVTRAWVVYFVAVATISVLLFFGASFETWARFSNLLSPLALAAMFVGERFVRYRLHPEFERTSIRDAIQAYMHTGRPAPATQRDPLV